MNNKKVVEMVEIIEVMFRELVKETGEEYISAVILNGNFSLDSAFNEKGQKVLNFYRKGQENE